MAAADQGSALSPELVAKYDLTAKVGTFMDRHLIFPLLEFLQVQAIYPEPEIMQAKLSLLQKTNMVDFAMDIYQNLHNVDTPSPELVDRRTEVVGKLKELQVSAEKVVAFLTNPALVKQLRSDKAYNLEMLSSQYQIGEQDIEALYHYAKFQFDCGNYSGAAEFLRYYRSLASNNERSFSALWGKFAADILMQDWEEALEDMTRLKEIIDSKMVASPMAQLTQRTWLAHWSLFVFFNHENGRNAIIDLFFQDRYMNAIQTNAHHLLRYLAAAVIVNKRRRNMLKDLVRIIQQESHAYSDPITEFLECLFVNYDFEGAQQKLRECDEVLKNDFFLVGCREEFVERARHFVFETYCRIHQCIDVRLLADKLNMEQDEAERWVVNLIRNERLNAKIDANAGTVVMGSSAPSVYEQLLEKTKQISHRGFQMASATMAAPPVA